jgi:NAD(P)-dependent dehydrogenase (short-subunit alcohol dehydrogenase family)
MTSKEKRIAWVTGGSSGISLAGAEALAADGWTGRNLRPAPRRASRRRKAKVKALLHRTFDPKSRGAADRRRLWGRGMAGFFGRRT